MNTFLRQRVLEEPPNPHPRVTLKSARPTFPPEPNRATTCHTSTPMLAAIMTKNTTCIHGAMLPNTSRGRYLDRDHRLCLA